MTDQAAGRDKLTRAYASLMPIKEVVAQVEPVMGIQPHTIKDYNRALDHLTEIGFDVDEYRVRDDEFREFECMAGTLFERGMGVPRDLLLSRVSAVLNYFSLTLPAESSSPPLIGFTMPRQG
jgi:site-specific recombinase XerC